MHDCWEIFDAIAVRSVFFHPKSKAVRSFEASTCYHIQQSTATKIDTDSSTHLCTTHLKDKIISTNHLNSQAVSPRDIEVEPFDRRHVQDSFQRLWEPAFECLQPRGRRGHAGDGEQISKLLISVVMSDRTMALTWWTIKLHRFSARYGSGYTSVVWPSDHHRHRTAFCWFSRRNHNCCSRDECRGLYPHGRDGAWSSPWGKGGFWVVLNRGCRRVSLEFASFIGTTWLGTDARCGMYTSTLSFDSTQRSSSNVCNICSLRGVFGKKSNNNSYKH